MCASSSQGTLIHIEVNYGGWGGYSPPYNQNQPVQPWAPLNRYRDLTLPNVQAKVMPFTHTPFTHTHTCTPMSNLVTPIHHGIFWTVGRGKLEGHPTTTWGEHENSIQMEPWQRLLPVIYYVCVF